MKSVIGILVIALSASGCIDSGCVANESSSQSTYASNSGNDLTFSKSGGTSVEEYAWNFESGKAEVTWTGDISAGSVTVTMLDGCGNEVYNASIAADAGTITRLSSGDADPGKWLVIVAMSQVAGTASFEVSPA